MVKVKEDMTGWVMSEHGIPDSRWKVLYQTDDYIKPNGERKSMWVCECSCEKHTISSVVGTDLRNGRSKSCGCLQKEKAAEACRIVSRTNRHPLSTDPNLQLNLEDEYGLYGIGHCHNTGQEFYFDMDDYDLIKDYCWKDEENRPGYRHVRGRDFVSKKYVTLLSVLGCKAWDYIDRNTFNNRRYNLRPATASENAMNRSLSTRNTSGFKGVSWDSKKQKWRAQIQSNNKQYFLGNFNNKTDAVRAYLTKAKELHGEFFYDQSLFDMLTEECC